MYYSDAEITLELTSIENVLDYDRQLHQSTLYEPTPGATMQVCNKLTKILRRAFSYSRDASAPDVRIDFQNDGAISLGLCGLTEIIV